MGISDLKSIQRIVEEIQEILEPVVSAWGKNHPADAELVPTSARACLYQDVFNLGHVIFSADALGQTLEIRTLAEVLSTLAKGQVNPERVAMEERLVEKITQSIESGQIVKPTLPLSIQVARAFDDRNNTSISPQIEDLFDQLLDSFILRDGNVTVEELSAVKIYESLWKKQGP